MAPRRSLPTRKALLPLLLVCSRPSSTAPPSSSLDEMLTLSGASPATRTASLTMLEEGGSTSVRVQKTLWSEPARGDGEDDHNAASSPMRFMLEDELICCCEDDGTSVREAAC